MKEKILKVVKNKKKWILLLICIIMFLFILENVLDNEIDKFDKSVYSIISLLKTDVVTDIFKVITSFGSAIFLIGLTLLSFIVIKNKKISISIAINLATIGLLNQVLKNIVQRPRPEGFRIIDETGYSFPSGHSMASTAFYGLIIYFIAKNVKNKKIRDISYIALIILIPLIGISRIYLGVHYASDVIAGFIVSIGYLIVYITIVLKLIEIKNEKK